MVLCQNIARVQNCPDNLTILINHWVIESWGYGLPTEEIGSVMESQLWGRSVSERIIHTCLAEVCLKKTFFSQMKSETLRLQIGKLAEKGIMEFNSNIWKIRTTFGNKLRQQSTNFSQYFHILSNSWEEIVRSHCLVFDVVGNINTNEKEYDQVSFIIELYIVLHIFCWKCMYENVHHHHNAKWHLTKIKTFLPLQDFNNVLSHSWLLQNFFKGFEFWAFPKVDNIAHPFKSWLPDILESSESIHNLWRLFVASFCDCVELRQ